MLPLGISPERAGIAAETVAIGHSKDCQAPSGRLASIAPTMDFEQVAFAVLDGQGDTIAVFEGLFSPAG